MDILQADDQGRMIEHWDVIAEWVDESVSGHGQFDGPTTPTDLDRTDENKALVASFIQDVLADGKSQKGVAGKLDTMKAAADQLTLLENASPFGATMLAEVGVPLDASHVALVGHSQGGIAVTLAAARAPVSAPVVLSGTGGGLRDTLVTKTSPYRLKALLQIALADPQLDDGRYHPVISLMQGYLEDADPASYGRGVTVAPLAGSQAKHVLLVIGLADTYTPNTTSVTVSVRAVR